ncbi:putative glycoside hydrolase/deacetylase ChbG (UPF0249 family) [Peribacillus deserti]|uniref:Carbohydrate deacetylase n=1 Tax=Peribacillus deserti TaxID=673318 RepID=A0ABS2QFU0_9BACI|nr:chitin disaccharide deacetylase [Peribacillus deserti]MBM7692027.1 putative glycoside hydrolase/deacetylase ChbG (UPF0249 family) [Peribacillus deserti]
MINLLINADDFGFSQGVNHGIIDCHKYGIVNSATMMMNMAGTEHAIELAKQNPRLKVGIHLVLTCGRPLLQDVPSLVDDYGNFNSLANLAKAVDISLDELEREWTAQVERFLASGLKPTHLDSHHHVHTMDQLLPVIQKLSNKYDLPVRVNGNKLLEGVKPLTDLSLFDFYGESVSSDYFLHLHDRLEEGKTVEIMCHPAYLDTNLLKGSSYTHTRLKELEILTSVQLPGELVLL